MVLHRVCPGCRRERGAVCARCLGSAERVGSIGGIAGLDRAAALFRYTPAVQRMVVAAKNQGRRDVLRQLGAVLADEIRSDRPALVTWVPASRSGRRRRGYDQGEVLAATVAAELGIEARRLLTRGRGRSQGGKDRTERLRGPSFRALDPSLVGLVGALLVVDDVLTTGASMGEAARVLRRCGAQQVCGATIAWTASPAEVAAGQVLDRPRSA